MDVPSEYQSLTTLPASEGKSFAVPSSDEHGRISAEFLNQIIEGHPLTPFMSPMVMIDLAEEVLGLRHDCEAYDKRIKELCSPEFVSLEADKLAGGHNLTLRSDLTVLIAASFGSYLTEEVKNFVAIDMVSPDPNVGKFEVIVRKAWGKSTADVLKEKDEEIARLKAALAERVEYTYQARLEP